MKELVNIVKLLFKDAYRTRNRGKFGYWAVIGILYLIFEVGIILALSGIAPAMAQLNMLPEFITFAMTIGLTAVAALGIMSMLNLLYFSRDSEFLLSLPVSPTKIYFAKLILIYATQLAILAAVMLPALFTVGIMTHQSVVFYITMVVATAFLPVFSLLALSVICLPLMYIVRFFKNRGAVSSVMAMIVYIVIFAVYFVASMHSTPSDDELAEMLTAPMKSSAKALIPFAALSRFATLTPMDGMSLPLSMFVELLIFLAFIVGLFAITVLISHFAYSRSVALQLESRKRSSLTVVHKGKTGITKALMAREWKGIIRTPVFAMQCLLGLVLAPLVLGLIVFTTELPAADGTAETLLGEAVYVFIMAAMVQMLTVSVNIGASTSFSREGGAFYISKLLPVPYKTYVRAKACLFNIVYSVSIVVCFALLIAAMPDMWLLCLVTLVYMLVMNCGFVALCLLLDLSNVNLEWKSYREIVKNSRNSMMPLLVGMALSTVFGIGAVGLAFVFSKVVPMFVAPILAAVIMAGLSAVFAVITNTVLIKNCDRYFDAISA